MKTINVRQIGNNVIAVIDNKQFSRSTTKEDRETLFKKIEMYNKKNNEKLYNDIVKLLTPVKEQNKKAEEVKQTAVKGKIKLIKKDQKQAKVVNKEKSNIVQELTDKIASGGVSDEEMKQLEALFNKNKKVTEEVKPVEAKTKRSGEY